MADKLQKELLDIQEKLGGTRDVPPEGTTDKLQWHLDKLEELAGGGGSGVSDVKVDGQSVVSEGSANLVTKTPYNATTNPLATMADAGGGGSADFEVLSRIEDLGNERYKFPKDILPLVYYTDDIGSNLFFDYTINKIRDDLGFFSGTIEIDAENNQVIMDLNLSAPALNATTDALEYHIVNRGVDVDLGSAARLNAWTMYHGETVNIYYSQLKNLRDNEALIPGQKYRITDFVTTTNTSNNYRSAGHPFDIIVTALAANELSSDAKAILHSEDDNYFNEITTEVISADWADPNIKIGDVQVLYKLNNGDVYFDDVINQNPTAAVITQLTKKANPDGMNVPAMLNPDAEGDGGIRWYNEVATVLYSMQDDEISDDPVYHWKGHIVVGCGVDGNGKSFLKIADPVGLNFVEWNADVLVYAGRQYNPYEGDIMDKWQKLSADGELQGYYYLTNIITDSNGQLTVTEQQIQAGLGYDVIIAPSGNDWWYIYKGPIQIDGQTLDLWYEWNQYEGFNEYYLVATNHIVEAETISHSTKLADLSKWEINYCLDNDTTKFNWADSTTGKGVIYYLKDEWNNECYYDFKNIQYNINKNTIPDGVKTSGWFYTFSAYNSEIVDASLRASSDPEYNCMGNRIGYNGYYGAFELQPKVFWTYETEYDISNNIIGNNSYNIVIRSSETVNNKIGDSCSGIYFGSIFKNNIIGTNCDNLGAHKSQSSNLAPQNIIDCVIGDHCSMVIFGSNYQSVKIGNNCSNIWFTTVSSYATASYRVPQDYVRDVYIDGGNKWVFITANNTNTNYLQNLHISFLGDGINWSQAKKVTAYRNSSDVINFVANNSSTKVIY